MKQYVGPLTCLFGLLLALVTAAKPPVAVGEWPDTFPYTLGGCGVAMVGLLLWRRQPRPLWTKTDLPDTEENLSLEGGGRLEPCVAALQRLHATVPSLTMTEVADQLETLYIQRMLPLVQTHKQLMVGVAQEQGLARLNLFSQGELWINRARSAAGDQHREETLKSLQWAVESLLAVQQLLDAHG